jgi:hypothetical protein
MHSFSQIEVKESRNASNLLPIKFSLLISDLDFFAMVSGHVCADVTLASRDGLEELWKGTLRLCSGSAPACSPSAQVS